MSEVAVDGAAGELGHVRLVRRSRLPAAGAFPRRSGVVVLDRQHIVRVGFASAVARLGECTGLEFVGEAATLAELRDVLARVHSSVVVLDPGLAEGSDVAETVRWLITAQQRILVFSEPGDLSLSRRAVEAGAHGVSSRSEAVEETIAKVGAVAAGQYVIPAEWLSTLRRRDLGSCAAERA